MCNGCQLVSQHIRVANVPNMKTISERLTHAREKKGWSKSRLATASGLTPSAIGNIESGIRQSKASLVPIAKVLDVSYEWLANGKGPMETTTKHYELVAEPGEYKLDLTSSARELGKLFDLIPETDLIKRGRAYNAASAAILDVLQEK